MSLRFGVLGPLEVVTAEGTPLDLGGRQPRTMLAVLLVADGRPVPVEQIIDAIWGDEPPASAIGTLQSYVSRLRRRLGETPLTRDEAGYRLEVPADRVDHRRFERLADEGRTQLDAGATAEAHELLRAAEQLWRGPALGEFVELEFAAGVAVRLDQRRLATIEDRVDADLQLGRHAAVVGELSELVAQHPLRERLRQQLALALYRSGRQADALRSLADAGRVLREELGIEPSRGLRDLETAILAQDPALDLAGPPPAATGRATPTGTSTPAGGPPPPGPPPPGPPPPGPPASPGGASPPVRTSGPLVGRDTELAELEAALAESADDYRFAVVEGEPGIGKTRLVDELRAVALEGGALAVWGRSDEGGAAPALWPWLPPLRALAERVGAVPDPVAELLAGDVPAAPGQAPSVQFDRFEAVHRLIDAITAVQPVVVLLDDLQWADATSLELLAFLAGRSGRGLLVAGTLRQLEVGRRDVVTDTLATLARRPGSRRLVLTGLSADATAAVLERSAGGPVRPDVAAAVHSRAEGNPFYAIELARLLDEERGLGAEVPGTVGDVIRRRLARLADPTREALAVGAVVGRDVPVELLARATGEPLDGVLDALDDAVAHRLLVEVPDRPAELRFSHALVREVLLEDLTSLRRARLHLRVADAIEAGGAGVDDVEILADHLWRAAPVGVGKRAAEALERAAEVALRRVAYGAAEDLLSKAVQLRRATSSTREDHEAELSAMYRLLEVARARRYFQGAAQSIDVIDRAKDLARLVERNDILLDLLWFEWSALATASRVDLAHRLAGDYRALTADDPDPEIRASGHQVQGVGYWCLGRIAEAVEHLDRSEALLAGVPLPEDSFAAEKRTVAHTFWLWNHVAHGDLDPSAAWAAYDDLLARMPDRFAVASICGFAATTAIAVGDWDRAERYAGRGMEADPGAQFSFWAGQVMMQLGVVWAGKGWIDEAIEVFDAGKERYTGVGGRSALATFEASLGLQLARQGRIDEGRRRVEAAREELETYREGWNATIVLIAEAVLADALDDPTATAAKLSEAVVVGREQGAHAFAARAEALAVELGVSLTA